MTRVGSPRVTNVEADILLMINRRPDPWIRAHRDECARDFSRISTKGGRVSQACLRPAGGCLAQLLTNCVGPVYSGKAVEDRAIKNVSGLCVAIPFSCPPRPPRSTTRSILEHPSAFSRVIEHHRRNLGVRNQAALSTAGSLAGASCGQQLRPLCASAR